MEEKRRKMADCRDTALAVVGRGSETVRHRSGNAAPLPRAAVTFGSSLEVAPLPGPVTRHVPQTTSR